MLNQGIKFGLEIPVLRLGNDFVIIKINNRAIKNGCERLSLQSEVMRESWQSLITLIYLLRYYQLLLNLSTNAPILAPRGSFHLD